ncbi:MAG: HDOD domain-containing protein [Vulcanimicrobiota bacterium]
MNIVELEDQTKDLKTLPATFYQVSALLEDPTSTAGDVGRVISADQVLSAKLLAMVNSSFYGFSSKISSITKAAATIGFAGVRNLVLSTSVTDLFLMHSGDEAFNRVDLWKHCLGCGIAAKVIGNLLRRPDCEELFVAGLLHDIGKVIIDQYMNAKFVRILNYAENTCRLLIEAESEVLGYTHCQVGEMVASRWELSLPVREAIVNHHCPSTAPEYSVQAAIVHCANSIVQGLTLGHSGNCRVPLIDSEVAEIFPFRIDMIEPVMTETLLQFNDLKKVFFS